MCHAVITRSKGNVIMVYIGLVIVVLKVSSSFTHTFVFPTVTMSSNFDLMVYGEYKHRLNMMEVSTRKDYRIENEYL